MHNERSLFFGRFEPVLEQTGGEKHQKVLDPCRSGLRGPVQRALEENDEREELPLARKRSGR